MGYAVNSREFHMGIEQVFDSTDAFKEMPVDMRKCMLPEDDRLPILGAYTEADCYLECTWRLAVETCNCVLGSSLSTFLEKTCVRHMEIGICINVPPEGSEK